MSSSFKKTVRFVFWAIFSFALVLLSPNVSLAQDIYYTTECNEQFLIGSGHIKECSTCCDNNNNCWSCCPCCVQYSCTKTWKEYKATSEGCKPQIMTRNCRSVCGPASDCCSCGPCHPECDPWETCEECGSWQKAERSCLVTKAGLIKPKCKCNGDCLDKPENPRYYDNPDYPTDPCNREKGEDPNNVYLPVKLDWDDVRGWWEGWCGAEPKVQEYAACHRGYIDPCWKEAKKSNPNWKCHGEIANEYVACLKRKTKENCERILKEDEACGKICPALEQGGNKCFDPDEFAKSYRIKITGDLRNRDGSNITSYTTVVGVSEFFAPWPCFFKSNRTYKWKVQACCDENGNNCGPWSDEWSFKTNPAPEPKLPYDPDWNGREKAENLPFVETLEWCDIEDQRGCELQNEWCYPGRMGYDGKWHYKPLSFKFLLYYADYFEKDPSKYQCYPDLWHKEVNKCYLILKPDESQGEVFPPPKFLNTKYEYLTKLHSYAWKVSACKDIAATECTDYSQEWKLASKFQLEPPKLNGPPNDQETPIGLPVLLQWAGATGTHSYIYEINGRQNKTSLPNVSFDYPQLSIDTLYWWKVQPCWDFESKNCEQNVWSETYYFRTTGRPPKPGTMRPAGDNIPIPVDFKWESVPGAKSFLINIWGDNLNIATTVEKAIFSLYYPDLKQKRNYSWKVKTCARENGELCGDWSEIKTFKTFTLSSPSNPIFPERNKEIFTYQMPETFSWDKVPYAKYYKYIINYVSKSNEETDPECNPGIKISGKTYIEKIVPSNSDLISLNCLGNYQWQVQACLDENCDSESSGDLSDTWSFTLSQKVIQGGIGLVPCGRTYDDPRTPWKESETCQIKHLFFLFQNLLDFFLWKICPIILVLLMIVSGVVFYFSMGAPETIVNVKTIWKYAGIGYGIIFLAWTIVNLLLAIIGYQVVFFGHWWKIRL